MSEPQQPEVIQERSVTTDPITGVRTIKPKIERRLMTIGGQKMWMPVSVFDQPEDDDLAEIFGSK